MSGASVRIDASQVVAQLQAFRGRAENLSPVFAVIAEHLVLAVDDNFDSAGHGTWPPLKPSTVAKRRRRGRGAQILKDTGALAADQRPYSGSDFAEVATNTAYAVYHVDDGPRTRLPLRNFYDIPEAALDEAEDILMRGILGEAL